MKKLTLFVIAALTLTRVFSAILPIDSLKQGPLTQDVISSLKNQLDTLSNDSLKSGIYAQLAAEYLKYDTIGSRKTKLRFQNEALNYSYLALHLYSRYDDSVGMRNCFDNLARVYHSQKKYPQAKWFILQSNTLSRALNDVPNITASLVKLASIKMDIKDYSLAMRDLNEALQLSVTHQDPRAESIVQYNYAMLYNRMKNYSKGTIAFNRHLFIDDSIRKSEAMIAARNAATDSVEVKKKMPLRLIKRSYRPGISKKIASL